MDRISLASVMLGVMKQERQMKTDMIALGYMLKKRVARMDTLENLNILEPYSVAGCSTENFVEDFILLWRHNGYWLFDSPAIIKEITEEKNIDTRTMLLFYYEAYKWEFDFDENGEEVWKEFHCDDAFATNIKLPEERTLVGYDVVEYCAGNAAEDSLATCCNGVSNVCPLNKHGLFLSFEDAKEALTKGIYHDAEPGPYRILAVYLIEEIT